MGKAAGFAQRSRAGVKGRNKGPKIVCEPGSGGAASVAIISPSFPALKLTPISGAWLYFTNRLQVHTWPGKTTDAEEQDRMVNDLWESYCLAMEAMEGGRPQKNLLAALDKSELFFTQMIKKLKGYAPEHDVMVEGPEQTGHYFFTLYRECDDNDGWMTIAMKPMIRAMDVSAARTKKPEVVHQIERLRSLLLQFIRSLIFELKIEPWWGSMRMTDEWLEQQMMDLQADDPTRENILEYKGLADCRNEYEHGAAAYYRDSIVAAPNRTPDELLKLVEAVEIKELPKRLRPILDQIKAGALFMQHWPYRLNDYGYCYQPGLWDDGAFPYEDAFTIVWDENDAYSGHYADWLDDICNNIGTINACFAYALRPGITYDALQTSERRAEFPKKLKQFFIDFYQATKKYERGNK